MLTAHIWNEKITEELWQKLDPRTKRGKVVEYRKAMKTNPFGATAITTTLFKKEPKGYIQPHRRGVNNPNGYQNNQRGRENLTSPNSFHGRSYKPRGQQNQQLGQN